MRHTQRLARLDRIRSLADEDGRDPVVDRVDELIDKENARHAKWMSVYAKHAPSPS
jgi:hypothetical protein